LTTTRRAIVGGCALGFATGWNIANTGSVASQLSEAYGVGLAAIGLFTTALFITHAGMQIPAGRAADRFGARRTGILALTLIAIFNVLALIAPDPALALAARLLIGIGTGLGFIAGSAYVRSKSGSAFAQGVYGGVALGGGGLALAIVPAAAALMGWRASFVTAIILALGGLALLASGPPDGPRRRHSREAHVPSGVVRDVRLYKLAVLFSFSLGLSVVLGNWVTTLLQREGGMSRGAAGVIAALTLVLGVASRPLGGWILHTRPGRIRVAVGASLVAGALGSFALAAATPPALTVLGAMLIGVAAGIPFAPAFQGAARLRPDAQAAAVGFVNGAASMVILVGTPLLGLSFSLPGGARAGFVAVAFLWTLALLLLPSNQALAGEVRSEPESLSG
jgi:MFS family permease